MPWWELEEAIGHLWHRLVGNATSYPHYPDAAVSLSELRTRLSVFYRGIGGVRGVPVVAGTRATSRHRLTLRQRLGLGDEERLDKATFDGESVMLPERIAYFSDRRLNEKLYFWLAAYLVHAPAHEPTRSAIPIDPLQADIRALRISHATTRYTIQRWPGLRPLHTALANALRDARPARPLADLEAAMEEVVLHILGGQRPSSRTGREILAAVHGESEASKMFTPSDYRPFLPVPLWGAVLLLDRASNSGRDSEASSGGRDAFTEKRLNAKRRSPDRAKRKDPLVLYRFEHIPTFSEMLDVSRPLEDDDVRSARKAAQSLDEITLASHDRQASSRLKLDLDLSPSSVDAAPLITETTYPEWDFTRYCYHRDHCRVIAQVAGEDGVDWRPDAQARRRIRAVRRRFEAMRPQREILHAQPDGEELDLNALVRSYADRKAGAAGSDHVYAQFRDTRRDLAVAILVDASLSTDSWVNNRRVLDVEKEAVIAFTHGLSACGDSHGIFTFSSRKRHAVEVRMLKDFDEPLNSHVHRRIEALRPGFYTRIGAALRHTAERLDERPNRHRLLLLLTDGKPNDFDHYEGRYGIEDTRRAIGEARQSGLAVFGITIDSKARDYFPYLFGRGAYAIVPRINRLPAALPAIYRQITR